jgi:hypothetical protein
MLIPQWLRGARKRWVDPQDSNSPVKKKKKTEYQGLKPNTIKKRTTPEEVQEVIDLFNQGLTFYAIIEHMGWNSTSRIKKIAKDYGLVRKVQTE